MPFVTPEKFLNYFFFNIEIRNLWTHDSSKHHFYASQLSLKNQTLRLHLSVQKRSYVFDSARSKGSFLKIGWCANRNHDRRAWPKHELTWIRIFDGLPLSRWGASSRGAIINGGGQVSQLACARMHEVWWIPLHFRCIRARLIHSKMQDGFVILIASSHIAFTAPSNAIYAHHCRVKLN